MLNCRCFIFWIRFSAITFLILHFLFEETFQFHFYSLQIFVLISNWTLFQYNYQKNMGFYMGGHVYSPYVPPIFFTSPRTYPNRIGINYAILNNGINLDFEPLLFNKHTNKQKLSAIKLRDNKYVHLQSSFATTKMIIKDNQYVRLSCIFVAKLI